LVRLRPPSAREIAAALRSELPLSYPEAGATAKLDSPETRNALASRYDVDHRGFALGRGRALFERAQSALRAWRHFEIPWLEWHGAGPAEAGQVVATVARVAGLWFLNPCRVVYADFPPGGDRVAYAYGTLPGHPESGEERFLVSFDPVGEGVRFEIAAFSRPAIWLSTLGYPLARRIQRRFAASAAEALAAAAGARAVEVRGAPTGEETR